MKIRLFDLLVAAPLLICALPVMVVVACIIKLTSPGSVIFAQARVGQGERVFTCLKFRTMAFGVPDVASHQAGQGWITPVGRVLRKFKLDELPQLINVLRGDMSLVGPRPCLPSQQLLISERRRLGVFGVRTGSTGRAQLAGVDMSEPERLALIDSAALRDRSVTGHFALLVKTLLGQGMGDAAPASEEGPEVRGTITSLETSAAPPKHEFNFRVCKDFHKMSALK